MRAGKNVWVRAEEMQHMMYDPGYEASDVIRNDGPDPSYDDGKQMVWYHPLWATHRVRGYKYTPYRGDTDWVKQANQSMSEAAQYNFAN